jgi:hypothetical protein
MAVVLATFLISSAVPFVFQYASVYASPTAAYAYWISSAGHISAVSPNRSEYWQWALKTEEQFPVPAILLSILMLVANLPGRFMMFLPIVGIASLVYFVISRRVIGSIGNTKGHVLFFSAVCYGYVIGWNVNHSYVGRGTFGMLLLSYFLLAYLAYLKAYLAGHPSRGWLLVLSILTITIAFTYYFGILSVLLSTVLMIMGLRWFLFRDGRTSRMALGPAVSVTFIALALAFWGPLSYMLSHGPWVTNPMLFIHNLALAFTTTLHLDVGSTDYLLQFGIVEIDPLTRLTGVWLSILVKVLCGIALLYAAIAYRPRKHKPISVAWVYTLVAIFFVLAELGYLFQVASLSLRFAALYGSVILFFIIGNAIRPDSPEDASKVTQNLGIGAHLHLRARPARHILAATCLIMVLLATIGSVGYSWNYGVSVPGAYSTVAPLSIFLETHSSNESPVVLVGDAYFVANLFFIAFTHNATSIVPEPLEMASLPVYRSIMEGNKDQFTSEMSKKGAGFFLSVRNGRPLYGDEGGYAPAFTIPSGRVESLGLSLVYNDGTSQLYSTR